MWTLDEGKLIHIVIEKVGRVRRFATAPVVEHLGEQNGMVEPHR